MAILISHVAALVRLLVDDEAHEGIVAGPTRVFRDLDREFGTTREAALAQHVSMEPG